MSRSYRSIVHLRKSRWLEEEPPYLKMKFAAEYNPSPSFRIKWRREVRNRIKQQILECTDWDELSLETRINRLTDVWDWY